MSHYWHIHCPKHQEDSESFNHAKDALVAAIQSLPTLKTEIEKLEDAGWVFYASSMPLFRGIYDVTEFLYKHADCGTLIVHGEFASDTPVVLQRPSPTETETRTRS